MKKIDRLKFAVLGASLVLFIIITLFVLGYIIVNGVNVLSWEFLTTSPSAGMTKGGIMPCIVGTVFVSLVSFLFSVPIGVAAGVYLGEYAGSGWFTSFVRASVRSLAGIPSIVFGLFGVAFFVRGLGFGASILSSGLTLGLMNLPWIISTTEEAVKSVPDPYREGAYGLGATRWETVKSIVLPSAFTGIMTGVLLAMSRAVGETAPILFTGVTFYSKHIPSSVLDRFMALPYHLYVLSTQHENIEAVRPIAFGTAFVLLIFVFILDGFAFYTRMKLLKREG